MCKTCDVVRGFDAVFREHGVFEGDGTDIPTDEAFDAAINAPLIMLANLAGGFPDREDRQEFLREVVKELHKLTRKVVAANKEIVDALDAPCAPGVH